MITTKDYSHLPDRKSLESICKAISVLDAIISQEWEYRYYSFNSKWGQNERCLQMRNGSGEEMYILFREGGCAINGFAHERTFLIQECIYKMAITATNINNFGIQRQTRNVVKI